MLLLFTDKIVQSDLFATNLSLRYRQQATMRFKDTKFN